MTLSTTLIQYCFVAVLIVVLGVFIGLTFCTIYNTPENFTSNNEGVVPVTAMYEDPNTVSNELTQIIDSNEDDVDTTPIRVPTNGGSQIASQNGTLTTGVESPNNNIVVGNNPFVFIGILPTTPTEPYLSIRIVTF